MVFPPLTGNPNNGYINPYYWVDGHPLLYGNNGSLGPGAHTVCIYTRLSEASCEQNEADFPLRFFSIQRSESREPSVIQVPKRFLISLNWVGRPKLWTLKPTTNNIEMADFLQIRNFNDVLFDAQFFETHPDVTTFCWCCTRVLGAENLQFSTTFRAFSHRSVGH